MQIEGYYNGQRMPIALDASGRLLTGKGSPETSYTAGASITNSTADTALKVAAGALQRNYVTDLIISNTNATALSVQVKDGATALGRPIFVPATATVTVSLNTPFRTTANTALNAALTVALAAAVDITVVGYTGL